MNLIIFFVACIGGMFGLAEVFKWMFKDKEEEEDKTDEWERDF